MKITAYQEKRVTNRRIYGQTTDGVKLELVTFELPGGFLAFGCRAFTDHQSVITDLYSTLGEAVTAGHSLIKGHPTMQIKATG